MMACACVSRYMAIAAKDAQVAWFRIETRNLVVAGTTGTQKRKPPTERKAYSKIEWKHGTNLQGKGKGKQSTPELTMKVKAHYNYIYSQIYERPDLWFLSLVEKPDETGKGPTLYFINVYLNLRGFAKAAEISHEVTGHEIVANFIQKSAKSCSLVPPDAESATIPTNYLIPRKQPNGLNCRLHRYQLDAVAWMHDIEDSASRDITYSPLLPWSNEWLIDDIGSLIHVNDPYIETRNKKVKIKGGILGDEMGLGKTLEVIALVLANPARNLPATRFPFYTKATLVITPNHLTKQWAEEIKKHTEPVLNVIVITTMGSHKKYTYQDIRDADIVVVSRNFLVNKAYMTLGSFSVKRTRNYLGQIEKQQKEWKTFAEKRAGLIRLREEMSGMVMEEEPSPIFDFFHWRRIVIDEGHEFVSDPQFLDSVADLTSDFRWYVTGTPFPNTAVVHGIVRYLQPKIFSPSPIVIRGDVARGDSYYYTLTDYEKVALAELLISNFYMRNTKTSIKEEYHIPNLEEELLFLDFHPVEAALYAEATMKGNTERQRLLCNHPLLSPKFAKEFDGKWDLEALRVKRAKIMKNKPQHYKQKLKQTKEELDKIIANRPALKEKTKLAKEEFEAASKTLMEFEKKEGPTLKRIAKRAAKIQKETEMRRKGIVKEKKRPETPEEAEQRVAEAKREEKVTEKHAEINVVYDAAKKKFQKNENSLKISKEKIPALRAQVEKLERILAKIDEVVEFFQSLNAQKPLKQCELASEQDDGFVDLQIPVNRMTVAEVKEACISFGLPSEGKREDLAKTLEEAVACQRSKIVNLRQKQMKADPNTLQNLIFYSSTKLAHFLQYTMNLLASKPEAKIIVFSQYSEFLNIISNSLNANYVSNVFVKGNVNNRNNALDGFKNSSTRVILLSLENAASGSNLNHATHIFLMDTVPGTKEEVLAVEGQAIGILFSVIRLGFRFHLFSLFYFFWCGFSGLFCILYFVVSIFCHMTIFQVEHTGKGRRT
eukprot:TRINITY_DN2452_c0_g1_i2.p1 TRINITY_DN2452_c0_g1~~TRINITY_DN2452_c0_g1_i2.p1  ORF type:complete len:1088 (-),score=197.51 TRINITY_DN2452_c0_g1_i2:351-3344(-)